MKLNYERLKMYFGQRLKELRIEKGITQENLGKVLGVTKGTISRYENGVSSPGVSEVKLLSEYFNVNFYWLAGTSDDKYNYNPTFNKIPVICKIVCGMPIYAADYIIDYEYISNKYNVHFALIAKGDSMVGARINDGDIVFIRQQLGEIPDRIFDMRPDSYSKRFKALRERTALKDEDIVFHDLRHYQASWLYKNGMPDQYSAERLGHDIITMKKIYQHLDKSIKIENDKKIIDMFS